MISCMGLGFSVWTLADIPTTRLPSNSAAEEADPSKRIRLGYFVDPLDKFDRTQLRSSLDSWSSGFASPRFPVADLQMFYDRSRLEKALASGQLDAVILYGYQFIDLKRRIEIEPAMLFGEKTSPQVKLVLIVRKDAGITSIASLRGKWIMIDTARLGQLPILWLRHSLAGEGIKDSVGDFAKLEPVPDAFNAMAPVFFGNADACILTRTAYTKNAQLNAQIVQKLHILLESRPLAARILAFPPNADPEKRQTILDQGEQLPPAIFRHSFIDPSRRKLTTLLPDDLLSIDGLVPPTIPPLSVNDFYSAGEKENVTTTIDNRPHPEGNE